MSARRLGSRDPPRVRLYAPMSSSWNTTTVRVSELAAGAITPAAEPPRAQRTISPASLGQFLAIVGNSADRGVTRGGEGEGAGSAEQQVVSFENRLAAAGVSPERRAGLRQGGGAREAPSGDGVARGETEEAPEGSLIRPPPRAAHVLFLSVRG